MVLFLHNTSRVEGEKYGTLLQEKGFTGFPSLAWMDADGNVIAKQGERSVDGFVKSQKAVAVVTDLKALAARGGADEKVQKKLLLAEIDLGQLDADAIKERAAAIKNWTDDEKAKVDQSLTDAEVRAIAGQIRQLGPDKAAEQVAAIAKAGRRPSADQAPMFWQLTLTHAANTVDGELGQQAYDELMKAAGDNPRYARAKESWQKLLDKAKAK